MRYEECWIPLLAHHSAGPDSDLTFLPPLDVHWVWHLHMLAPLSYREDLLASRLGRIINHQPRDPQSSQAGDLRQSTREKWLQLFPGEPFTSQSGAAGAVDQTGFSSSFTYDILKASSRQKVFYYQVSLPHFQDRAFLKSAIKRYCMFLQLKLSNPGVFLVPCYDIDIAWHSHQVSIYNFPINCS